jgi:hypothetical protein
MANLTKHDLARIHREAPIPKVHTTRSSSMENLPTQKLSDEELRDLRQDAQHNVAGAHDALHGNPQALAEWRRTARTLQMRRHRCGGSD